MIDSKLIFRVNVKLFVFPLLASFAHHNQRLTEALLKSRFSLRNTISRSCISTDLDAEAPHFD